MHSTSEHLRACWRIVRPPLQWFLHQHVYCGRSGSAIWSLSGRRRLIVTVPSVRVAVVRSCCGLGSCQASRLPPPTCTAVEGPFVAPDALFARLGSAVPLKQCVLRASAGDTGASGHALQSENAECRQRSLPPFERSVTRQAGSRAGHEKNSGHLRPATTQIYDCGVFPLEASLPAGPFGFTLLFPKATSASNPGRCRTERHSDADDTNPTTPSPDRSSGLAPSGRSRP